MVTTFYPPYNFGGDGIFVQRLSNELARRGHLVDVIHCVDSYRLKARELDAPVQPALPYDDHPNVTVHPVQSRFGFLSPLATQQTGFPLFKSRQVREIMEQPFDVIHFHNVSLVGGPRILGYGSALKLYTMHEYWLLCPTHVLFKNNREACTEPQCLTCSLVYKRPPQWWRHLGVLDAALRDVDAFLAPSRFTQQLHQERMPGARIEHVPHFLPGLGDEESAPDEERGKALEEPFFLYVGRLEKLKGVHTLIPIFKNYRKARLFIAGTGSAEGELRHMASDCDNIQFLGHQSHRELQGLYQRAVALLAPSLCYEVFPLVILEAFQQQTPAIARNLGGMTEAIRESGGGLNYDSDEELVAALDRLLEDPGCRREMGCRGYRAYQERWTADAHLERYFELIGELDASRR